MGVGLTRDAFGSSGNDTFAIPAGPGWHVSLKLHFPGPGTVSGTFRTASDDIVVVFLLEENQHAAYVKTGSSSVLTAISGSSGRFSFSVQREGQYFLTFEHGAGYELVAQEVRLDWWLAPLYPGLFVVGAASIAAGAELALGGLRLRSPTPALGPEQAASPTPSTPSEPKGSSEPPEPMVRRPS